MHKLRGTALLTAILALLGISILSFAQEGGTKIEPFWYYFGGEKYTGFSEWRGLLITKDAAKALASMHTVVVAPFMDPWVGMPLPYVGDSVARLFEVGISKEKLFLVYDRYMFEALMGQKVSLNNIKVIIKELKASGVDGLIYGFVEIYRVVDVEREEVKDWGIKLVAYLADVRSSRILWVGRTALTYSELRVLLGNDKTRKEILENISTLGAYAPDVMKAREEAKKAFFGIGRLFVREEKPQDVAEFLTVVAVGKVLSELKAARGKAVTLFAGTVAKGGGK